MSNLKFTALHTIILGKGASAKTVKAGEQLPKLPVEELIRLQDLGAIIGTDGLKDSGPTVAEYVQAGYDPANYPPEGYLAISTEDEVAAAVEAFKVAAAKVAAEKAAADKAETKGAAESSAAAKAP